MSGRCPATTLVIPPELLEAPANTDAYIFRLPNELLLSIFCLVGTDDKVCLALSCKRMLQASTLKVFLIPSVVRHRILGPCSHMQSLMVRLKPLDSKGRKKKSIAICVYCVRYRPKNPSYWENFSHDGVAEAEWSEQLVLWSRVKMGECPECWYKRALVQQEQLAAAQLAAETEAQLAAEIAAQNAISTQNGDQDDAQNGSDSDNDMDDISLYTTSSGYGPSEYESTNFDSEEEEQVAEDSEDYSDEDSSSDSDVDMEM